MKTTFWILGFIFTVMTASAQTDSWKIKLNNKILLATATENEKLNTRRISNIQWVKKGYLEINFKEGERDQWKRSFLFFDENDEQRLEKTNTTYTKISITSLRKLFAGKKEIRIYTIKTPVDPNIAIRARRVHLCTLRLP